MTYCTHCGTKLRDGANFCDVCGCRVGSAPGTVPGAAPVREKSGGKILCGKNICMLMLTAALFAACVIVVPGRVREAIGGTEETVWPTPQTDTAALAPETVDAGDPDVFPADTQETASPESADSLPTEQAEPEKPEEREAEKPEYGDFAWYTDAWQGIPADAAVVTDVGEILGTWKGLVIYDPEHQHGASANELVTVEIAGSAQALTMTVQPCAIDYGSGMEDESGSEAWQLEGAFSLTEAYGTGICTAMINTFYRDNGNSYGIGSMETAAGVPAKLVLIQ